MESQFWRLAKTDSESAQLLRGQHPARLRDPVVVTKQIAERGGQRVVCVVVSLLSGGGDSDRPVAADVARRTSRGLADLAPGSVLDPLLLQPVDAGATRSREYSLGIR